LKYDLRPCYTSVSGSRVLWEGSSTLVDGWGWNSLLRHSWRRHIRYRYDS